MLASLNGFIAVSLFVAYLMAVVAAVHERRAIGASVGHLGPAPVELVAGGAADGFAALNNRLSALTARLETAVQRTDAFPILGHDREADPSESFTLGVASLGETAILLSRGLSESDRPPAVVTDPLAAGGAADGPAAERVRRRRKRRRRPPTRPRRTWRTCSAACARTA